MRARILVLLMVLVLTVPKTVMAADIVQDVEINIECEKGNYTAILNIADAKNAYFDDMRFTWQKYLDKYGITGRVISRGIIPAPVKIPSADHYFGVSYRYLTSQDMLSGGSVAIIRVPIATDTGGALESCKIYMVTSNIVNITKFDDAGLEFETPGRVYEITPWNYTTLEVTYPWNITADRENHTLMFYYVEVHAPLMPNAYYFVWAEVRGTEAYYLCDYEQGYGLYGTYNTSFTGYELNVSGSFSMLLTTGMSENVYSFNIPGGDTYFYIRDIDDYYQEAGSESYWNIILSFYLNNSATVSFKIYGINDTGGEVLITERTKTYSTSNKVVTEFIFANYTATVAENWDKVKICMNSTQGADVYFFAVASYGEHIYRVTTTRRWFEHTMLLAFIDVSNVEYVFKNFSIPGINTPIIIKRVQYVYSILDIPIIWFKAVSGYFIIEFYVKLLTFGQVDLDQLFEKGIMNIIRGTKYFIKMAATMIWDALVWLGQKIHAFIKFIVSAAQWWGYWLLQFLMFFLNITAYIIFMWPWIVLFRGFVLFQTDGVGAMVDYYSAFIDKATSIMSKLISKVKGVKA